MTEKKPLDETLVITDFKLDNLWKGLTTPTLNEIRRWRIQEEDRKKLQSESHWLTLWIRKGVGKP